MGVLSLHTEVNMPKRGRSDDLDMTTPMLERLSVDDEMAGEIEMNFEFFQFQPEDYHDVKNFLHKYLEGEVYEAEELSDELIEQFYIGSMIKMEDNESPVGFLSAFNIIKHGEKACCQSIKKYFLTHLASSEDAASLQNFLQGENGHVLLALSERLESVPLQLTPHLYTQLYAEIQKALLQEKDDNVMELEYDAAYLLLKARVFYVKPDSLAVTKSRKETSDARPSPAADEDTLEKCYYNPEEEIVEEFAEFVWRSKSKGVDSSRPNSMDRHVIKEEFVLLAVPMKSVPAMCKALTTKLAMNMMVQ